MEILKELRDRKILKDVTNEEKLSNLPKGASVYIGFDPTATSLHLGNYIQIAMLLRFKKAGYNPIAVLGGATGMIGDPSGKSKEREMLDKDVLLKNKAAIKKQLESFGLKVIDNYDFYKDVNILEFLGSVGKLININYMINKDIVASRLETGISFTEFSYQLIQGNDFLQLYKNHNVSIQVGGSDQWGNITTGIELIRKVVGTENNAVGITTNLLLTASGKKFGKSEGNAIWIDKSLTSPYSLYQYILNTSDEDLSTIFNWITFLSISEINEILKEAKEKDDKRWAQKILAKEIVKDIHGLTSAESAIKLTETLFGKNKIKNLTYDEKLLLKEAIPTSYEIADDLQDFLVNNQITKSRKKSRELIEGGSLSINGVNVIDTEMKFQDIPNDNGLYLIKASKKKYYLVIKK